MDSTPESPTAAAQRLEQALERIALAMANAMAAKAEVAPAGTDPDQAAAVKARLDALIDKLRAGLADRSSG